MLLGWFLIIWISLGWIALLIHCAQTKNITWEDPMISAILGPLLLYIVIKDNSD